MQAEAATAKAKLREMELARMSVVQVRPQLLDANLRSYCPQNLMCAVPY